MINCYVSKLVGCKDMVASFTLYISFQNLEIRLKSSNWKCQSATDEYIFIIILKNDFILCITPFTQFKGSSVIQLRFNCIVFMRVILALKTVAIATLALLEHGLRFDSVSADIIRGLKALSLADWRICWESELYN